MDMSSTPSSVLSSVVICMTIMAVCAVVYFAIRCYFEEKRLRYSQLSCKCATSAGEAAKVEAGSAVRIHSERPAANIAVQTVDEEEPWAGARYSQTLQDARMSDANRIACAYSSPLADNESVPCWRPPATGSSRRYGSQRTGKRRYRRRAPVSMVPAITIRSPSSSDSYSVLTTSHTLNSLTKTVRMNKDLTTVNLSGSDEELPYTSPFHPRYNTPVSEMNEEDDLENGKKGFAGCPEEVCVTMDAATQFCMKRCHVINPAVVDMKFEPSNLPQFEILPGGKLVTRWTQTDNGGSLVSLDWDHYESERLRCADNEEMRMNATLLAAHTSDMTLHASRTSHRSVSPYVLCFENEEFHLNDDRKLFRSSPQANSQTETRCSSRANSQSESRTPPQTPQPLDLRTAQKLLLCEAMHR